MKKKLYNIGMRSLSSLLIGKQLLQFGASQIVSLDRYKRTLTILGLCLFTVITFGTITSPTAVFADDSISEATADEKIAQIPFPKMGDCQFYVKLEATVNGQKKKVQARAGSFLQTAKGGAPLDAECKGKCDDTGPDGEECGCAYMSLDGPPVVTGLNDDGTPRLEVVTVYHTCTCAEIIKE